MKVRQALQETYQDDGDRKTQKIMQGFIKKMQGKISSSHGLGGIVPVPNLSDLSVRSSGS